MQMQAGDILLFKAEKDFLSKIVAWSTNSKYSHVAICVSPEMNLAIEALTRGGVKARDIRKIEQDYDVYRVKEGHEYNLVETISFLLNALSNYQLGASKTKVLMVSGVKDGRYPVDLAKSLNLSESYKHIILPGGHATHFEYQNEFTDVFIAWLIEVGLKKLEPRVSQRTKDLRKTHERLEQEIKMRK